MLGNRHRGVIIQNAFIPSRAISDNLLLAHKMIEFIRKKKRGRKTFLALKLDRNKAYDRVRWPFLKGVLHIMGFSQH